MKTLNKKLVKQISKMLLVLLAFNLVATSGIKASAATNAAISYTVTGELKKGNTVKIDLNVKDATNLYGASWDMAYDQTLLKIKSITPGTVFPSTASNPVKEYANGKVEFALTLTGNVAPAATSGTIATIEAEVLKDGGSMTLKTSPSNNALSATGVNCRVKLANTPGSTVNADIPYTATDKVIGGGDVQIPSKLISFTADKNSSQPTGTTINFTANANPANSQYCFYVSDGKSWTLMQNYSSKNTFAWKPTIAGNYIVRVRSINTELAGSASDYKDINFTITGTNTNLPSKLTSFNSDKASGQTVGTTINFTANANPASSQYCFYVSNGTAWTLMQNYSTKNTFAWKPTVAGNYTVRVRSINTSLAGSASDYKDISFTITDSVTTKISTLTSNQANPTVGKAITFTATANTGANTLYKYYILENGSWNLKQDYSSNSKLVWTPNKAGTYSVRVRAINANNPSAPSDYKDLQFTVK